MMAELQKKQQKRLYDAMTPEERAAEDLKRNPVVTRDNINAKLANFEDQSGTQEAPTTKIMIGKGAPPPPPPPPPPPALKGAPPGAKAKPQPPVQQQQQQQQTQAPQQQQQQQQYQPQQQQEQQKPTESPASRPVESKPAESQAPQKSTEQQQNNNDDQIYHVPKKSLKKHQVDKGDEDDIVPQSVQLRSQVSVNYFMAIFNKNLKEDMNKVVFENKEKVLELCTPEPTKNVNSQFRTIYEGVRFLDTHPQNAVMYFQKSAKISKSFLQFLPNDDNGWSQKQMKENLEKLRITYKDEISNYVKNYTSGLSEPQVEVLNLSRYLATIQRIQSLISSKVQESLFDEVQTYSTKASELKTKKKAYDEAPAQGKPSLIAQLNLLMEAIEQLQ